MMAKTPARVRGSGRDDGEDEEDTRRGDGARVPPWGGLCPAAAALGLRV